MASDVLNINVGVLGHIDSGKTALAKALSTTASTAAFDKNPQSKERGITIDLGFSSFQVDFPECLRDETTANTRSLQFTLVDCPGHASLIKTIIGGAQIIDMMMLVVDVTKGMQTQTAECLVIGEITCDKMIVVLNKIDLLPAERKLSMIDKMTKKMQKTLEKTKFAEASVIPVAAKPGGPEAGEIAPVGIQDLIENLIKQAYVPYRKSAGPLLFSVDHCFSIKGQGTVMTGTVIQGSVSVNDTIEMPSLKMTKKVKSMQMFKKPVDTAIQGGRVGICVTQFDPKMLERGVVSSPGSITVTYAAVASVKKIPYFKSTCRTKAKFHISLLHDTVMAKVTFFGLAANIIKENCDNQTSDLKEKDAEDISYFDFSKEYKYQDELFPEGSRNCEEKLVQNENGFVPIQQFVLLEFERPVLVPHGALFIGSKLDSDIHANICRLAFYGYVQELFTDIKYTENGLPNLKIYKQKMKEGVVERIVNDQEVIGKSLFKKETNIQTFIGLNINLSTGESGKIDGSFGQSGKIKIYIPDGLKESTKSLLSTTKKKGKGKEELAMSAHTNVDQHVKLQLTFKRYIYDTKKRMIQL
ncbi:selenocysteine-specific elongation factor-like [Limulus polyphemus]|uniref:Selenocysteine-specific elongation factor-like n=1 Tax=Limulus polyphemus TaxID=6850 RepID=A0ABM1B474_LIMPO|nr:selenocysteine-specific elongation factor-like [Limulus polyphemus]